MKAMILAAGRGERLRPLTDHTPKPLVQVRGKALIEWHLEALARAGVREVVINLSWLGAAIREALGDGSRWHLQIHYSDEGPIALETGGGIYRALPILGLQPFLLINGDVYTQFEYAHLKLPAGAQAHLVVVPNPPQHPRGDFSLSGGWLGESSEERYTYSGIGIMTAALFTGCQDGRFPLLPLLKRAIAARQLSGERFDGLWTDVGTLERLRQINGI